MANRCNSVEYAQFLELRSDVRRFFEEQGVLPHDKLRIKNLETISKWSEEWQTLQRVVLDPQRNFGSWQPVEVETYHPEEKRRA